MLIGHTDPAKYHEARGCHEGAGAIYYMSLWDKFETNWMFIHRGFLPPKSGIGLHFHDNCEEMYVIFDNGVRSTHNNNTADLTGGSMVPCLTGESHGMYNHTDKITQFMNLGVAGLDGKYDCRNLNDSLENSIPGPSDKLPVRYIDSSKLELTSGLVHAGKGRLKFRRIWSHETFRTNWGFIDHIILPPDTSIGYHRHNKMEECYIILAGKGMATVNDETIEVATGDAIPNPLGGSHGIYNHTKGELEILNMAVTLEKGKFDTIDMGDDLSKR